MMKPSKDKTWLLLVLRISLYAVIAFLVGYVVFTAMRAVGAV